MAVAMAVAMAITAITCSVTTAGAGPLRRLDGAPVAQAAMRGHGVRSPLSLLAQSHPALQTAISTSRFKSSNAGLGSGEKSVRSRHSTSAETA